MRTHGFVAVLAALTCVLSGCGGSGDSAENASLELASFQRTDQDSRLAGVLLDLQSKSPKGFLVFVHVAVVDPETGQVQRDQTIVLNEDRISWVGPETEAPKLTGAQIINAKDKYITAGLVDMHVHTGGMGEHLLRLAAGVTTVRDMDGFPWLLRMRDAIAHDQMIGATLYVAGTIIADHPLDGYAVVVRTPEEARRAVRAQAACGYQFIKVHNRLGVKLFDAVASEAREVHLDLVGHVPHGITLKHAIQSGGMRTSEHLKGFLHDETLLPSDEDYKTALGDAEHWITPTLYTAIGGDVGAGARARMADPRTSYTPRTVREGWVIRTRDDAKAAAKSASYRNTQLIVMNRLLPLNPRWLAGTDAAGYDFNIAGFALQDEMELLNKFGVSRQNVLRAATSEPAVAMRRTGEFGRIAPGHRADLVLLDSNPLDDLAAYHNNSGVMANGRWNSRTELDAALAKLAAIYDEAILNQISAEAAKTIAARLTALDHRGVVFESQALLRASKALTRAGFNTEATLLKSLAKVPASGSCAATYPGAG